MSGSTNSEWSPALSDRIPGAGWAREQRGSHGKNGQVLPVTVPQKRPHRPEQEGRRPQWAGPRFSVVDSGAQCAGSGDPGVWLERSRTLRSSSVDGEGSRSVASSSPALTRC